MATSGAFAHFSMNPSTKSGRWKLIQEIFQSAIELPTEKRDEYLTRACGDDEELRTEIASLLDNDSDDTATLHNVVERDLKRLADASDGTDLGTRVGPYRLVRELDGGGMGVVYLAVRSDDH